MSNANASALALFGLLSHSFLSAGCLPTPQNEPPDLALPAADLARTIDLGDVARPSCAELLGGPELPSTSTEARPDFDAELAALDLQALPPRIDLTTTSDFTRATIAYLLGKRFEALGITIDRDAAL